MIFNKVFSVDNDLMKSLLIQNNSFLFLSKTCFDVKDFYELYKFDKNTIYKEEIKFSNISCIDIVEEEINISFMQEENCLKNFKFSFEEEIEIKYFVNFIEHDLKYFDKLSKITILDFIKREKGNLIIWLIISVAFSIGIYFGAQELSEGIVMNSNSKWSKIIKGAYKSFGLFGCYIYGLFFLFFGIIRIWFWSLSNHYFIPPKNEIHKN